jgi:hypothetical protein
VNRYAKLILLLVTAALVFFIAEVASTGRTIPYRFIKTDHPIDMLMDKTGRRVYYGFQGKPQDTVPAAREELIAQGFKEDFANRPWYRFAKGNDEVILCASDEIAVMGDKLIHMKGAKPNGFHYATVWIHEKGRKPLQFWSFKIKKTILFW